MPRDHSYECETCGEMRGGFDDLPCECDVGPMALYLTMSMLAHNLAIGAALCLADSIGWAAGYNDCTADESNCALPFVHWKPGCGESAPIVTDLEIRRVEP